MPIRRMAVMVGIFFSFSFPLLAVVSKPAQWTIMVYMNGKNNLETDAIENFLQIADVGSSKEVNLLVEMGRPQDHYTSDYGPWSGVLRFRVERKSKPTPEYAKMDLARAGRSTDMGSAQTLAEFIDWSRTNYPARHSMLIIWNHGQGWRFQLSRDRSLRARTSVERNPAHSPRGVTPSPAVLRSVSFDEDRKTFLYNRDIQDILAASRPVDILGFDACLMSMLETAYAMRPLLPASPSLLQRGGAGIMVASEELEPAAGWPYRQWLPRLLAKPAMTSRELSALLVSAYRERYGDTYKTTLSAIDLAKVASLAEGLTDFSSLLGQQIDHELPVFREARLACRHYGEEAGLETSVDLSYFLDRYAKASGNNDLAEKARAVRTLITQAVVANYASQRLQGEYGSFGIAIYFPASKKDFDDDSPDNHGYQLDNTDHPVEFVQMKKGWAPMLHEYFKRVPGQPS